MCHLQPWVCGHLLDSSAAEGLPACLHGWICKSRSSHAVCCSLAGPGRMGLPSQSSSGLSMEVSVLLQRLALSVGCRGQGSYRTKWDPTGAQPA